MDYEDIVKIINQMCKEDEDLKKKIGSAQLEYLAFKTIKDMKQIDFLKEEQRLSDSPGRE